MQLVSLISALGFGSVLSGLAAAVVNKRKDKIDSQAATVGLSESYLKLARATAADLEKAQDTVRRLRDDLEKMEALLDRYRDLLDAHGINPDQALRA